MDQRFVKTRNTVSREITETQNESDTKLKNEEREEINATLRKEDVNRKHL